MPFSVRQWSAAESGSQEIHVNQKYRKEKIPLCFESKRSIILRHNWTARAHNERGLEIQCAHNNFRVTCTLSSEHIIWTSKRVSRSTPSWRSWSSSFFFIFWARLCQSSPDILLCSRKKNLILSAKIIQATRTTNYRLLCTKNCIYKVVTRKIFILFLRFT